MRRFVFAIVFSCTLPGLMWAQVDDIKNASSSSSNSRNGGRDNSSSDSFAFDVVNLSLHVLIDLQRLKLQTRDANPSLVSVEMIGLAAVQPSSYYIVHPRIRANWALFSTDFRLNYLIEEDVDGVKHIRTDDWQVIQLNFVAERTVNFYVGWGFLHEAFNDDKFYNEWTTCLRLSPARLPFAIQTEYRFSEPRIEASAGIQYPVLSKGTSHLYLLAGGAFQQYYSSIHVWGIQGGLMLRIY
jgi:hypothetical protein